MGEKAWCRSATPASVIALIARFEPLVAGFMVQVSIATFVAAGMLAGVSIAEARTTQIQILTRTTAFGGYSFPGVGQYEVITGIATGEVDPGNEKNMEITDILLAPRLPDGNVKYQHNFYILKPLDLSKGNHKMMYEPASRLRVPTAVLLVITGVGLALIPGLPTMRCSL